MAADAAIAGAATAGRQVEKKSKRQPSRKGKKAWRANIDMTDVEEGLEEAREEERIGTVRGACGHFSLTGGEAGQGARFGEGKATDVKEHPEGHREMRADCLVRANKAPAMFDLWAEDDPGAKGQKNSAGKEFISFAKKEPVKVRFLPVRPRVNVDRQTGRFLSVSHLGASYRAPESARKELIALAGAVELKKENERVQLAEIQAKFFKNGSADGVSSF
ncbi:MAG: hypothetical protein BJ554DRAFT_4851 [Olpidium bornovanus]|uniref:Ribosome biogenesis protein NOP53 n=1 Tax=Olpidium bornovanus TaxID=278681 RepID=A0A8H7ZM66_9FUNG|nr:MAG: hypothetical protein BJ554DRAFT_4851 [Olpidium bornovanus]